VRLLPPFTVEPEDIDACAETLDAVLAAVTADVPA
jgi:hypothetical protein